MEQESVFKFARAAAVAAAMVALTHSSADAELFKSWRSGYSTSDPRSCVKIEQQQSADGWWRGKFSNDASCPRVTIYFNECRRMLGPPPAKHCQNISRVLRTAAEKRINNYQDKVELLKACAGKLCN
jgi:hypothetical protein